MGVIALKEKAFDFLKKYRYVVVILLVGLVLMIIPTGEEKPISEPPVQTVAAPTLQEELSQILGKIKGAGKVEVLLTEASGRETLYQTDTDQTQDALREDTVVVSDSQRQEAGLVRQIIPPKYQGAIVVCQGGDNPGVKLAILEAVMKATGLKSNQISVLKMK